MDLEKKRDYSILDRLLEGYQIIDFDFRFVYVNKAAALQAQKSKDELLGHTMLELFPGIETTSMFSQLKHCMDERKPITFDNEFTYPDGKTAWFALKMAPTSEGVSVLSVDITERKIIEETLRERDQNLTGIINAAPFGAHTYNLTPAGKLILMGTNLAADTILGIDNRALIGKTIQEAFPTLTDTEIPARYQKVAEDGIPYNGDQFYYNENGVTGSFEFYAIQTAQHQVTVFFRDITELAKAYEETLEGWSKAMDLRDKETEGHTLRVTETTVALAKMAKYSDSEMIHIKRGALLHDIGKMGVPDAILFKPGSLNAAEWIVMRQHPVYAYELLHSIEYLRPSIPIPHSHHEKFDGSGYPQGLKGEQIPMPARLFAIVDVWDALTSDRPYRAAWSHEKVMDHIQSLSGTHFDPKAVDLFVKLISAKASSK